MINIENKVDCCGCNACGDICPKNAISFKVDIEGFWYPEVDKELCINCGLCNKICPIENIVNYKNTNKKQADCFAAIHKNIEIRFDSTSGGVFTALASRTYEDGGYVGGAVFSENYREVSQIISKNKKDLSALRSSKYLQSNASCFYKSVELKLKTGEKVIVCGTPCQMFALRKYLRKDYDNLIIVDFICRGINSPKVFNKYLDYLENRFNSKIIYFKAKNKELGWRELTSKIIFENKEVLYDTIKTSYFTKGYLKTNVYCRPSCYECKFKGFPRLADITIADLWGAEHIVGKEMDNDMGTSLVMANNEKGLYYLNKVSEKLFIKEIEFNTILKGNIALTKSLPNPLVDRKTFYKDLDEKSFKDVAVKYIDNKNSISLMSKLKSLVKFFIAVIRASKFNAITLCKNIYYNLFCSRIKTNILMNKYIIIYSHTVLNIKPTGRLFVNGIAKLGFKKFKNSKIETRILIEENGVLDCEGDFCLGYGGDIEIFPDGKIVFGDKCATNISSTIICNNKIVFGDRTMLGRNVTIRDNNGDHYIARKGYKNSKPILIGEHVWLCEGCTVMSGSRIGSGSIISAQSVVINKIPSNSLALGFPARVIDNEIYWKY